MILKGSQRGGPRQLAAHLLNLSDNDHVTVQELRGFISNELTGAMSEALAIAKCTKCTQPIFSLSLNPPKDVKATVFDLIEAADRAEAALGLNGQPRAIVVHEKEGRRHAHVVWSRVDQDTMKAINLPFFKSRLKELSRDLYLEHDWTLPEGHRTNGWKNPLNFTLAEWQQAKRHDLDPREIKQVFQDAWQRSDNLSGFKHALEESGYYLAKGDRRGIVATDINGEVFSVSRWTSVKTKYLTQKLGKGDDLEPLSQVRADLDSRISMQLRQFIVADRIAKQNELKPFTTELKTVVFEQREERDKLAKLQADRTAKETVVRAARFRRGLGMLLDVLNGNVFKQRKRNEAEAYASFVRDRAQRNNLHDQQQKEREPLQKQIEKIRARHKEERRAFSVRLLHALQRVRNKDFERAHGQNNLSLEMGG